MVTSILTGAAIQFLFALAVHMMPAPKRRKGVYRTLYKAAQFAAANMDRFRSPGPGGLR